MTGLACAALALPIGVAAVVLRGLLPQWGRGLRFGLAIPLGLGTAAAVFQVRLWLPGSSDGAYRWIDASLWCLVGLVAWRWNGSRSGEARLHRIGRDSTSPSVPRFAVVALGLVAALVVAGFVLRQVRDPFGGSDAVAMWNLHARVLHGDVAGWRSFLGEHGLEAAYHADYPLLVPCSVARIWTLVGSERAPASPLVAGAFLLSVVLVLGGTVARLRDRPTAVLVLLVLLGSAYFVKVAARQFADVPLACYLLGAVAVLVHYEREAHDESRASPALPVVAGLLAGFAAWTKNEGLLFVVAVGVVWGARWVVPLVRRMVLLAVRPVRYGRRVLHSDPRGGTDGPEDHPTDHSTGSTSWPTIALVVGLLPGLLLAVWYKVAVAPPNDLVAGQSAGTLEKLLSVDRYLLIARFLVTESIALVELGGLALIVHHLCAGRDRSAADRTSRWMLAGVLGLMLAGYAAVYVATPWDLHWHLGSSARRLLVQLWPVALLWYALCVRPFSAAAAADSAGADAGSSAECDDPEDADAVSLAA